MTFLPSSIRRLLAGERSLLAFGGASQVYVSGLSLLFSPWVLRTIGPEAYGLVGVFLIAFAWFSLLDAGLTPALTREGARFRGGSGTALGLSDARRGLEWVVGLSALPLLVLAWFGANGVAGHWLGSRTLPIEDIVLSLRLMAFILLLRWFSGVHRGMLVGFERHATLYWIAALSATARFPGLMFWFAVVEPGATSYFAWQLLVSVAETMLLVVLSRRVHRTTPSPGIREAGAALARIARFAGSHGLVSLLRILITQTDKVILAQLLPLATFGYFSLAAAAAAAVNLIVLPINQMLMPRLTRLVANGDERAMVDEYRRVTRLTFVLIATASATLACLADQVLLAWTGDPRIVELTAPVLRWYTIGNAAMAAGAFAYYVQYARGQLRLHVIGSFVFLVLVAPLLYIAASNGGLRGTALVWAGAWCLYLVTWVTYTHRHHLDGEHWAWLFGDVLRPVLPTLVVGAGIAHAVPWADGRPALVAQLAAATIVLLTTAAVVGGFVPSGLPSRSDRLTRSK